jgi:hypothetical protein
MPLIWFLNDLNIQYFFFYFIFIAVPCILKSKVIHSPTEPQTQYTNS